MEKTYYVINLLRLRLGKVISLNRNLWYVKKIEYLDKLIKILESDLNKSVELLLNQGAISQEDGEGGYGCETQKVFFVCSQDYPPEMA